jgi:2'-5' RNA ligase
VRLFVAVCPPNDVLDVIGALPRPHLPGVRWTARDQWHVTLRFLGEVEDASAARDALHDVELDGVMATIGPRAAMLGRGVVQLPVGGLDDLAATVISATSSVGRPPEARPFRGHLTLARTKQRRIDTSALAMEGQWPVRDVELIQSRLGRGSARYETLATFGLRGL